MNRPFNKVDPTNRKTFPDPFQLVMLKTDKGVVVPGWYCGGGRWYSLRYKDETIAVGWLYRGDV